MLDKIPYCFTKSDVISHFDNKQRFDTWIKSNIKNGLIKRVRNGLYVSIDSMGNTNVRKFEIATKISSRSFVCYHSALEYYGYANQVYNNITIGIDKRFNSFEFDGVEYTFKVIKNNEQVNFFVNENIRVTSLERTIIDCIDNITLAGGIEEVLNALEQIKVLNEKKLLKVLNSYNKVLLYQKVGFLLEQYKDELGLSNEFFESCQRKLTNQTKYFLQDDYKEIEYNSKWKLMAPKNIKSRINGGF